MKVLQQLIQHFWLRGVLSVEQAHYLVESGFIRPGDLENYEPRPQDREEETVVVSRRAAEIYRPDELEQTETDLILATGPAESGANRPQRRMTSSKRSWRSCYAVYWRPGMECCRP